jgi:shikimate dehydrogenase
MDPGPAVIRLAVFGNPVSQSLSPRIHRAFGAQLGLEVDYRAIEATAADFPKQVQRLAGAGALGCNITLPFKQQAYALAQTHSETARRAGAANTLLFKDPWHADNTDGRGLIWDLQSHGLTTLQGAHIGLLGAGGAAAGVLAALLLAGPRRVTVANRTIEKARRLVHGHRDLGDVRACLPESLGADDAVDLLINATSLGHAGGVPAIPPGGLSKQGFVYDLNYGPAARSMAAWCRAQELPYRDGLGMLVGQAAESFRLWTGRRPDPSAVLDQLRSDLTA